MSGDEREKVVSKNIDDIEKMLLNNTGEHENMNYLESFKSLSMIIQHPEVEMIISVLDKVKKANSNQQG